MDSPTIHRLNNWPLVAPALLKEDAVTYEVIDPVMKDGSVRVCGDISHYQSTIRS